jgi:hypothetical protein
MKHLFNWHYLVLLAVVLTSCKTPPPPAGSATSPPQLPDLVLEFQPPLVEQVTLYMDGSEKARISPNTSKYELNVPLRSWERSRGLTLAFESAGLPGYRRVVYVDPAAYERRSGKIITVKWPVTALIDISISPTRETHAGFILAGDVVDLSVVPRQLVQSLVDDQLKASESTVFWYTLPAADPVKQEVLTATQLTSRDWAPSSWDSLRNRFDSLFNEQLHSVQASSGSPLTYDLINASRLNKLIPSLQYLGVGNSIQWTPDRETDTALIALVRHDPGIWSLVGRDIPIKDLRPVRWLVPDLMPSLNDSIINALKRENKIIKAQGINHQSARSIMRIMHDISYRGWAGDLFNLNVIFDPYYPAQIPHREMEIVMPDGARRPISQGTIEGLIIQERLPSEPGDYEYRLVVHDYESISYTNTILVRVSKRPRGTSQTSRQGRPYQPREVAQSSKPLEQQFESSSQELFVEALKEWSVLATADVGLGRTSMVAVRQIRDVDTSITSLFDFHIVGALLAGNQRVSERESLWLQSLSEERDLQIESNSKVHALGGAWGKGLSNMDVPGHALGKISHMYSYAINRALVRIVRVGPVVMREANISGWTRIHDVANYEIMRQAHYDAHRGDSAVNVSISHRDDQRVIDIFENDMLQVIEDMGDLDDSDRADTAESSAMASVKNEENQGTGSGLSGLFSRRAQPPANSHSPADISPISDQSSSRNVSGPAGSSDQREAILPWNR